MPATIRDVALCAGVSIKTVSRVLNDEPFVRDETRAKVMRAIEELGFVANLSAKRLAKGQSLAIGLLYHNVQDRAHITSRTFNGESLTLRVQQATPRSCTLAT